MARIQLKLNGIPVYDRLADVSAEFPQSEFKLLAVQPRGENLFEIAEVTTTMGKELISHFEDAPGVRSFDVIFTDARTVLIQFVVPISDLYEALLESGNMPRYPLELQNGWFHAEIIAPQKQLSAYTTELTARDIPYKILSLTQSYDSKQLLTDRQWEFITEAVERGYYDLPRKCTLTELANHLRINRSAASRLRHRAESRIIKQFVHRDDATQS
ncbi:MULTISPECIES: helix-turn-helix domain-containing protein [unclassified Natrinema]|uniref:helix-turn-helix domain-containing protein n=1 Tax=unclassified Natrinema TaxID=2622230 RepID=UPI0009E081A3|nr:MULTISPECIES: helix-turn-helix domain-containing protein [unclassified Natrinema]